MDTRAEAALSRIRALGGNLTGVYVHGSLALDCFLWDYSDIDYLTVVKSALTQGEKEELLRGLLAISKAICPQRGK